MIRRHITNSLAAAGMAAAVLLPLVARALSNYDYAADLALMAAMAGWWSASWRRRDFNWLLWAATSGWLFSLFISMVTPLWLMAWIALAPLYQAVDQCRRWWQGTAAGAVAGIVASITGLDWVLHGFAHFTGWGVMAAILFFIPFCLMALWQLAAWSILYYIIIKCRVPVWAGVVPAATFALLDWVPLKPAHIYWGYSQWPWESLIQVVDLTGVPGLAFLMGWSGYVLWYMGRALVQRQTPGDVQWSVWWKNCSLFAAVFVLVLLYGTWRHDFVSQMIHQNGTPQVTVAGVQSASPKRVPNSADELKIELAKNIVRLGATAAQSATDVDLIVYAESTAPMGFEDGYNPIFRTAYQVVARNSGAHVLVDNIGYTSATANQPQRLWREFLLLNPQGEIEDVYQKKRLVPVGESLPYGVQAPWLREIFSIGKTYEPGTGPATVEMDKIKVAPLVCVEALHEDLAREATRQGASILISPSNDGWFRSGKQARQHLWGAGFRAIENRRPFIRVANTGYSAAISAAGDTLGEVSPRGESWTRAWKIPLPNIGSLYSKWGHWFSGACGLLVIAAALAVVRQRMLASR